ncbi:hypothetical protein MMEU_4212 [Mycobacterium marinum str. Europe]|nr:hypothetical protein MMEU_4212 [Mycobacterium marinum str. Europe]
MDIHGHMVQVDAKPWTRHDALGHVESTSQAEYAGSIPVIGSTKSQFRGLALLNVSGT